MRLLVEAGNERRGRFAHVHMGTSAGACLSAAAGYSLRSCLIRAIASSAACLGLMPSVTMRWTDLRPDMLSVDRPVPPVDGTL